MSKKIKRFPTFNYGYTIVKKHLDDDQNPDKVTIDLLVPDDPNEPDEDDKNFDQNRSSVVRGVQFDEIITEELDSTLKSESHSELKSSLNLVTRFRQAYYVSLTEEEINVLSKIIDSHSDYPFYDLPNLSKIDKIRIDSCENSDAERTDHLKRVKSELISAYEEDAYTIAKKYVKDGKPIIFDSIIPIINNPDFIELFLNNKVEFTSVLDPELSRIWLESLDHIINIKGLKPTGNSKAGLNTMVPANNFAKKIGPILDDLEKDGFTTLQEKADELNSRGIKTLRHKEWGTTTVRRTQIRWKSLNEKKMDQIKLEH